MAKKSMINRELKRAKLATKYATKRAELKAKLKDPSLSDEEYELAYKQFHSLPRDSSPVRKRNRCNLTGRPHGYYRKFGLSKGMLRKLTMSGYVPGLRKASW